MADFYAPQFQPPPNFLQQYVQGAIAQPTIQSAQQEAQLGGLKLDQLRQMVTMQKLYGQLAQQRLTQASPQPQMQAPTGGIQNGPQSSVQQPQQAPLDTIMGIQKDTLALMEGAMGRDPVAAAKSIQETLDAQRNAQIKNNQIAWQSDQSPLGESALRQLRDNPHADIALQNNPQIYAQWPAIARQMNLVDERGAALPPTADNVRIAASRLYDQRATSVGMQPLGPPKLEGTVNGPLNSIYSFDRYSGNVEKQIKGEDTLHQVVGANGPEFVTASDAVGRTPYNAATFINQDAASSIAGKIARYEMPPLTGFALKSAQGQETMRQVMLLNPSYDATQYEAKKKAFDKFTSGKQGDTVRSLSVATSHLDTLEGMVGALNNGDFQLLNRLGNAWSTQTGQTAPTNFEAAKKIVADEVVKAIVGSGGGVGDREEASRSISSAQSPQQLLGVIQTYKRLMGGQLEGLRRQYEKATGRQDFSDFVSADAKRELGIESAPKGKAPQQALDYLKAHPEAADAFKAKYGYLPNG